MHKDASDILKSLHGFIVGPEEDITSLPTDQILGYLKSENIDPAPLVHNVRQRIGKLKAELELSKAHEKRMGYHLQDAPRCKCGIPTFIERKNSGDA